MKNMKIDLRKELKDFQGNTLQVKDSKGDVINLTPRYVLSISVLNQDLKSGDEKYEAYKLAKKLEEDEPNFSSEELVLMKRAVSNSWGILVMGIVYDILDNN